MEPAVSDNGIRKIVLAIVIVALLALALEVAMAGDTNAPSVCVSAVGPVDASGNGAATAVEAGACPTRAP